MDTPLVTRQLQAGYSRPPTQVTSAPANRSAVHGQLQRRHRIQRRVQLASYPSSVSLKSLFLSRFHGVDLHTTQERDQWYVNGRLRSVMPVIAGAIMSVLCICNYVQKILKVSRVRWEPRCSPDSALVVTKFTHACRTKPVYRAVSLCPPDKAGVPRLEFVLAG